MTNPNFPDGPYNKMKALKDTLNDPTVQKKLGQIMVATGVTVVASCLYLKHRDVVNKAISAQQDLAFETMWTSYDEGVKYGLLLAKHIAEGDVFAPLDAEKYLEGTKQAGQYAFGMFDRPA